MYYDILGISNYGYNQYINGLVESGKNTGKSQIFHGKIPMVSGFDFPVNQSIDIRSPLATIHGFIFVDISDTHGINHPQLKLCHWVWQMIPNDLCEQCPMYS
jgi:hypothetical protein